MECKKFETCEQFEDCEVLIHPQFRVLNESDISSFIDGCRKQDKVTLEGIGHMIGGRGKSTVSRILSGKNSFSISDVIIILRYFGYELLISKLEVNGENFSQEDYELDQKVMEFEEDIELKFKEK